MNTDDFERSLQRQPLRRIPEDWRETILRRASKDASVAADRRAREWNWVLPVLWRELIQPCRYAWSGMAALWLIFWMLNAQPQLADAPERRSASTASASERIQTFKEQRGMLVELTGPIDWSAATPTRRTQPKPHSELALPTRSC